jgi:hypothetical protein
MNLDSIRNLLSSDPFEPIEIRLANGDRHPVVDPYNVGVGKNVVMIGYPDSDRVAWCTPHQIVSIEKLAGVEPRKNGRHQ